MMRRIAALLLVCALAGCGFMDEVFSPDCTDIGVRPKATRIGNAYVRFDYVCNDYSNHDDCSAYGGVLCVVNR